MLFILFATFSAAKVRRIIYIASDLSKILREFNNISPAIYLSCSTYLVCIHQSVFLMQQAQGAV